VRIEEKRRGVKGIHDIVTIKRRVAVQLFSSLWRCREGVVYSPFTSKGPDKVASQARPSEQPESRRVRAERDGGEEVKERN
jgi:hypothetical protein